MKIFLLSFLRQSISNPRNFFLNLFCLTLGIGCSFFIYLFVFKELNTDKFHSKHDDIYKVFSVRKNATYVSTLTSAPMGPYISDHLPEVELFTRVIHTVHSPFTYSYGNSKFHGIPLTQVDTSFFKIFDFDLQLGSLDDFKSKPNGVFLLPEIAERFFGSDNPIGKTFAAEVPTNPNDKYEFEVIGLLKKYPEESTISPQIIGNIQLELNKTDNIAWGDRICDLYVLAPSTDHKLLTEKIKNIPSKTVEYSRFSYVVDFKEYVVKPLKDVYFFSANIPGNTQYGDQQLINVLIIIGGALLLLVLFNYIILNLGMIATKSQEIKTRRSLGASRRSVLGHFIFNALMQFSLAFGLVLIMSPLILDSLASIDSYHYVLVPKTDWKLLSWFFTLLIFMGLLTSFMVHFVTNRLILWTNSAPSIKSGKTRIHQTLIQFQMVVTIAAITCIFFMNRQIDLMQRAELGFNMENTSVVKAFRDDKLRQELSKLSYVESIAHGPGPFSNTPSLDTVKLDNGSKVVSQVIHGDHRFIETYGIDLVAGANLNPDLSLTTKDEWHKWKSGYSGEIIEVLVNQKFVESAGLAEPVGTLLADGYGFQNARIVGVVKDFQSFPFYYNNSPIVIGNRFSAAWNTRLGIKVTEGSKNRLDEFLKAHYAENGLDHLYNQWAWSFDFEEIYQREITLQKLMKTFTVVILLISCLGLFALNLFISTSRIKEIGIRKVNGAKVSEILSLLNKDLFRWVVIAFAIATPVAWYSVDKWLQNFAYKSELSWWVFALAGLITLAIALLTVSWQSWKAATRNPVEALRYE